MGSAGEFKAVVVALERMNLRETKIGRSKTLEAFAQVSNRFVFVFNNHSRHVFSIDYMTVTNKHDAILPQ